MLNYFRLVRWPNLLIMMATMFLVRYYLIGTVLEQQDVGLQMPFIQFVMLVLSVVFIAAAGYVINDYFDIRIDKMNNPQKVVLGISIPIRNAIPLHAVFTTIGVSLGIIVSFYAGNLKLVFIHLLHGLLLWLYSARYKRKAVWGNVIVAFSLAMVVFMVWLFEFFHMIKAGVYIINRSEFVWLNYLILFMVLFAFLISLIREIVKDVEDVEGDRRYGCTTLPVILDLKYIKWILYCLSLIMIAVLVFAQIQLMANMFLLTALYFIVIEMMMCYFLFLLFRAKTRVDFSLLSNISRMIMVAGLLSMQIYYINQ